MDRYDCGCSADGARRCAEHATWCCHDGCSEGGSRHAERECPPCRRERWLSIGNAYRPTKTRVLRAETRGLEGMDGPGE